MEEKHYKNLSEEEKELYDKALEEYGEKSVFELRKTVKELGIAQVSMLNKSKLIEKCADFKIGSYMFEKLLKSIRKDLTDAQIKDLVFLIKNLAIEQIADFK